MGRGRAHQIAAPGARAAPRHAARAALTPLRGFQPAHATSIKQLFRFSIANCDAHLSRGSALDRAFKIKGRGPRASAPQLLTPASDSSIPPLLERVFQERVARVSCLLEQALRISVAFLLRLSFSLLDLVLLALDRLL